MAQPTKARNGGLADNRLLFAMWDNERAAIDSADSASELSDKLKGFADAIESLEDEVKELRLCMASLGEMLEKLPAAIEDALESRGV